LALHHEARFAELLQAFGPDPGYPFSKVAKIAKSFALAGLDDPLRHCRTDSGDAPQEFLTRRVCIHSTLLGLRLKRYSGAGAKERGIGDEGYGRRAASIRIELR